MPIKPEPLNTLPLIQYLQQVKQADTSRAQEIRIPIDRAKALAYTLGMVMSRLEGDLEKYVKEYSEREDAEVVQVQLDGGANWK
jgi:hypothetical protein